VKIKIPRWCDGNGCGGLSGRSGWAAASRTHTHACVAISIPEASGDNEHDEIFRDARRVARLRPLVYELPLINM